MIWYHRYSRQNYRCEEECKCITSMFEKWIYVFAKKWRMFAIFERIRIVTRVSHSNCSLSKKRTQLHRNHVDNQPALLEHYSVYNDHSHECVLSASQKCVRWPYVLLWGKGLKVHTKLFNEVFWFSLEKNAMHIMVWIMILFTFALAWNRQNRSFNSCVLFMTVRAHAQNWPILIELRAGEC